MTDKRTAKELELIALMCERADVDATRMLEDPTCDFTTVSRTLRMIHAAREGMRPRIERRV